MYSSRSPCSRSLLRSPADASLCAEDDPLPETGVHDGLRKDISKGSDRSCRGDSDKDSKMIQRDIFLDCYDHCHDVGCRPGASASSSIQLCQSYLESQMSFKNSN